MILYLKIGGIVGIIIICTILGEYKSKEYIKRVEELKNVKNALNIFKNKIKFTYEPIGEIFEEINNSIYENRENIFKKCVLNLKNNSMNEAWNRAIDENSNLYSKEDIDILKMLGRDLGKTDKTGQIASINVVEGFLDSQIFKAEEEKNKNYKLYKTLGAIIGCTIGILLF